MAGWPTQLIVWRTPEFPSEQLIDRVSVWPGFAAALVGDSDDLFWQSANQTNTYDVFKRPWNHLPLAGEDRLGRPAIDVSGNPGRQEPGPGMWLWAAAKMRFGPVAFMLFDRDRLLSLPIGEVVERDNGVIAVDLYNLDDPLESIREAQSAFREWMGFDELRSRAQELRQSMSDPALEFETGSFDHGGVRLVTEWYKDGELTPRSRATSSRRTELNEDGSIAWVEDSTD
ncbi:MAG: hypothetical protein GY701_17330 [Sulfitobacter sp.]|nr:hypothetical protein [Sulfitobacter sp.]